MPIRLYNSYTRRKEIFRPFKDKIVKMYNCGPTVYDYVHIGNLRAFLFADVLRRYLEYRGYEVKQVMNITDVGHMTTDADAGEDKMALAVRREGKSPQEVARLYEQAFFDDLQALGVRSAWKYPRASEHVDAMIKLVKKLLKRGHAYTFCHPEERSDEGSRVGKGGIPRSAQNDRCDLYYDLSTFPRYGKLSGNRVEDLIPGTRAEVVHEKRNPYDFALWIYKPQHFLQWKSPWGRGYPGWHLECSAMAMKYLGETLDIHTGGEDNKFPHHECEIAQSEGATGKQFARTWLHVKHLLSDGRKMSKSRGNFYTLRDLADKARPVFRGPGGPASVYRSIRYALIAAHYRDTLNFTMEGLKSAQTALGRLDELAEKMNQMNVGPGLACPAPSSALVRWVPGRRSSGSSRRGGVQDPALRVLIAKARRDFIAAMDDDLNVPKALGVVFEFVRKVNKLMEHGTWNMEQKRTVLRVFQEFDAVLGLGINNRKKTAAPAEVIKLIAERETARREKDWARADALRKKINSSGYALQDAPEGPRIKPLPQR